MNYPGGYQIEVITSFLSYDGSRKLKRRETVRGVTVIRLPTSAFGRGKLLGRAIDYLTFYLAAFFVSGALTTSFAAFVREGMMRGHEQRSFQP